MRNASPTMPSRLSRWLETPLSVWWCAAGWLVSTALFVAIVRGLGGPTNADSDLSTFSTWAIAHGRLSCAFPSGRTLIAPVYPYLSGGIAAVAHVGGSVPLHQVLGSNCSKTLESLNDWAVRSNALPATLRIGYLGWAILLVGIVAVLRTCGRGRCGWEPLTLVIVACLPPVWMSLENYFHPQDLLALGLALGAVASARRGSWLTAGALVAVAVLCQQFAILVGAQLLVLVPNDRRLTYVASAVGTVAIAVAYLGATSGHAAVHAALLGTGNTGGSGTWVAALHLHGTPLLILSRILPIALSLLLAWLVLARLGPGSLQPVALLSIISLCFALRLVFEQAFWGYYLLALAVGLVLLDVIQGHIRAALKAWLMLVALVFTVGPTTSFLPFLHVSWGTDIQRALVPAVIAISVIALIFGFVRSGGTRNLLVWCGLFLGALAVWPSTNDSLSRRLPSGYWQLVIVGFGIVLAARPLVELIQSEGRAPLDGMEVSTPKREQTAISK